MDLGEEGKWRREHCSWDVLHKRRINEVLKKEKYSGGWVECVRTGHREAEDPGRDKQEFVGKILEPDAMIKEGIFYFDERERYTQVCGRASGNEGPQG